MALKALLSVLLGIPETRMERIEVLNPMQYSEVNDTKLTVLDLKVHLNDATYVLVEMQVRKFEFWTNRTLAYASRAVADQVKGEFDYKNLEPVIQISIMNYSLFPEHKRFFAKYTLRDEEGQEYTDKLRFYVMDLTQIEAATNEQQKQGLVEWAKAFRANSWTEVNEIENSGVKEAAKTMQVIMANPTEREMLRMRRDAEIDRRTEVNAARRDGLAQGLARGKAEGLAQGKAEGLAQGKAEGLALGKVQGKAEMATEMAAIMKREGVDPSIIAKSSGLTLEEIHAL